jgi:THO complex subunit 2
MAPSAQKRKRGDRNYSDAQDNSRPSPHRPQNLGLAQQNQAPGGGRGGRRSSRGGNRGSKPADRTSLSPVNAERPPLTEKQAAAHRTMDPPTSGPPAPTAKAPFVDPVMSFYQYVTDDCISRWTATGRQDIKDKAMQYIKDDDLISLSAIVQEIVRSICSRRLAGDAAGLLVKDILAEVDDASKAVDITRHFLDCFSSLVEGQPLSDGDKMQLQRFLADTAIDPSFMREQFEHQLLEGFGLAKSSFHQMATRYSTGVLYKQTTYNLLREDTEGYAKLISEYYLAAERGPATADQVTEAFEKVKSLIGAFNLDPGRTLDVTLDVFGDLLIKRHRFFVRFLRASSFWPQKKPIPGFPRGSRELSSLPWWAELNYPGYAISDEDRQRLEKLKEERDTEFWDRVREVGIQAYFELGNRRVVDSDAAGDDTIQSADVEWIRVTKTHPPEGNRMAAQLLGFKLQYYASDIREESQLPENLMWLAALLIHVGFISLRDLYPHMHPSDDGMEAFKQKLIKEKEERDMKRRPGGGVNALTLAGALVDDTLPIPRRLEPEMRPSPNPESGEAKTEEPALPEPENQKILLLKSLLLLGAIPEALFILGRFPWLIDLCPDLTKYVHRILNHSISAVYEPLRPLADRNSIRQERPVAVEQAGLAKGHLGVRTPEPRRSKKWGKLDTFDPTKDADYKFYWEDWSDGVPMCRTVDDVFAICSSLVNICGVRIGEDVELVSKLARIGRHSLDEDASQANQDRWIDLCKRLLVPALSFADHNPALVNEVWELLRSFSTSVRYSMYSEWFYGQTSRLPEMRSVFDLKRTETKDILKRIHKQNAREMAKVLAKVVHSCPGIVFSVTLNQIEAYNNLIDVVVECARYFTSLGYDVLTWSILTSLGAGDRNRMQADGMLTSPWLRALSVFAGSVFKRYSNTSPSPVLRYISSQLYRGKSEDLEILEQIIASMTGIRSDTNYGEEQLRAMAGGPLLRQQTLKQVLDKRHESVQSSKRLMRSLTESDLAGQILILIAQERQIYAYREQSDGAPLKVLGNNVDKIHHAFVQYLDMLRSNVSDETFREVVPSIHRLIKDFGLDPSIAFAIWRDSIGKEIEQAESKADDKAEKPASGKSDDVKIDDAGEQTEAKDVEMTDAQPAGDKPDTFWGAPFQSLMDSIKDTLPPNFEDAMSLSFYVRFWQLSLYDFVVPKYESETKRLKDKLAAVSADRSDVSINGVKRRDAEKKSLIDLQEALGKEMKAQLTWYQGIRRLMQKEKDRWFADIPSARNTELSENIIQECFFPRILLSPMEAVLCSKLIFYIHQIGTPGFRTIHIFDKMLRKQFLRNALFQCTAREAENFGRFLNEVFQDLAEWHREKSVYETKAWGPKKDLPGFCQRVNSDYTPHTRLEYNDFKALFANWHKRLHDALIECLTSDEYMHIRNAIIMLKAIHQQFPRMINHGTSVYDCVSSVSTKDPREDLKLSALSLLSDLKKRRPHWIAPAVGAAKPTTNATARPSEQKSLDPRASEFRSTVAA